VINIIILLMKLELVNNAIICALLAIMQILVLLVEAILEIPLTLIVDAIMIMLI
jgi:hypothetical protein